MENNTKNYFFKTTALAYFLRLSMLLPIGFVLMVLIYLYTKMPVWYILLAAIIMVPLTGAVLFNLVNTIINHITILPKLRGINKAAAEEANRNYMQKLKK